MAGLFFGLFFFSRKSWVEIMKVSHTCRPTAETVNKNVLAHVLKNHSH